ncbi:rhodanese-like domain-containing protein [Alteromonas sp. BMJM2]|uniref:rhodanese-like domain-containing protein n=1 Tax=Alteromonas sp. BMJM2 TaxID=2954241 RepID=UPI0022B3F4FB|nr:rhodanese-like domain-containing protein [Alteromonas sp. BMJM2]
MKETALTILLFYAGLVLFPSLLNAQPASTTNTMTVHEVHNVLNDPMFSGVLIDVRTEEEYAEGHIKDSLNIPVGTFHEHIEKLRALERNGLVIYCRTGRRAAKAIDLLLEAGVKNITYMEGDMKKWKEEQLPIVVQNEAKLH